MGLMEQINEFLLTLSENHKYNHLRLPLQVACLISPIFLLGALQIHKSKLFSQRYKLMLVGHCSIWIESTFGHDSCLSVLEMPGQQTAGLCGSLRKRYLEGTVQHGARQY